MKNQYIAVIAALSCVGVSTPAFAQRQTIADCDPAAGNGPITNRSASSCSANGATVSASAEYTALKAGVTVGKDSSEGTYFASAQTIESAIVSKAGYPDDKSSGRLIFTYDIDGTMSAPTNPTDYTRLNPYAQFGMYELVDRGFYKGYEDADASSTKLTITTLDGSRVLGTTSANSAISLSNNFSQDVLFKATYVFTFNVIFGQKFEYSTYLNTSAFQPNSYVNFLNTASLSRVEARDGAGNTVSVDFAAASGADYSTVIAGNVASVPEPATWAMMLIGFGGIGGMMRRRRQSATVKFA